MLPSARFSAFALLFAPALLTSACSLDTDKFEFSDGALGTSGAAGAAGATGVEVGGTGGTAGDAAGTGGTDPGGAGGFDPAGAGGDAGSGGGGTSGAAGVGGAAGGGGDAGTSSGIPCNETFAGTQRCGANETVEECDGTEWVPDPVTCANGCVTKGVDAFCKACEPSSVRCTEALLEVCKADGSGYDAAKAVTCGGAQPVCNEAVGACTQCKEGESICINTFAASCTKEGVFPLNSGEDCGVAARCVDGACLTEVCQPGETKCQGADVQNCKADQSGFADAVACSAGASCVDGLGCVECTQPDGTQFCDGDIATTCVGGKKKVNAACATNECVVSNNLATCSSCTDGTVICAGDSLQKCQSNVFQEVTLCGSGTTCNATLAACTECAPGDTRCQANGDFQICGSDGLYKLQSACGKANLCDVAKGGCLQCAPGSTQCTKEGLRQACSVDGKWETKQDCLTGALCDVSGNTCISPTCEVGETSCGAGRQPLVCRKDRSGWDKSGAACAEACMDFKGDTDHGCVTIEAIEAGADATCAILGKADRRLACWGAVAGTAPSSTPQFVPDARLVTQVALGANFACAVYDEQVHCWGMNGRGQLGPSIAVGGMSATPVTVALPSKTRAVAVVATDESVCALGAPQTGLGSSIVACWGAGIGGAPDTSKPAVVTTKDPFVELTARGGTVCGTTAEGRGFCWGSGNRGKLGDGGEPMTIPAPNKPVAFSKTFLTPLTPIASLSEGGAHGCAVDKVKATDSTGLVYCWGANGAGQLGRGTNDTQAHSVAAAVTDGTAYQEVVAGDNHSCGMTGSLGLTCWGAGNRGQSGQTSGNALAPTKVGVPGTAQAGTLTAGGGHTCVMTTEGSVCWGDNGAGQLGLGASQTVGFSAKPVPVVLP
jgi:hypothetical protein